jgi:hypothetical protein
MGILVLAGHAPGAGRCPLTEPDGSAAGFDGNVVEAVEHVAVVAAQSDHRRCGRSQPFLLQARVAGAGDSH